MSSEMEPCWYKWHRAPDDIKAAVLQFIKVRGYRIAREPSPYLYVHPLSVTVESLIGRPVTQLLEEHFDSPLFVPFGDKMIAAWCRSLEVELKDA